MKKIPVAQIFHSQGNVHHELQQGLQRNMLGSGGDEKKVF
jgi:hypothetical protein